MCLAVDCEGGEVLPLRMVMPIDDGAAVYERRPPGTCDYFLVADGNADRMSVLSLSARQTSLLVAEKAAGRLSGAVARRLVASMRVARKGLPAQAEAEAMAALFPIWQKYRETWLPCDRLQSLMVGAVGKVREIARERGRSGRVR